ncbi:MAG TPA: 2-amino-4-hydroxy-6-hydroxymethyldihydropteridine diphosphokinase [Gammaproteobacteria bacterium]
MTTGGNDAQVRAFIGLGSNLDDPRRQLERALAALSGIEASRLVAHSSLYRSRPIGPQDQPDFLNAVAELETRLAPEALLDALQAIEDAQGRVRERFWGPRTLDLDLLLYGEERIRTARLDVPHPGLPLRAFVLYPLRELAADFKVPGLGTVAELAAGLPAAGVERLD